MKSFRTLSSLFLKNKNMSFNKCKSFLTHQVKFFSGETKELQRTALYDYHKSVLNGKMISFEGFEMPVQYFGIIKEHLACRENAALFDVSHMGQVRVYGKDRFDFIENLCVSEIKELKEGSGSLTNFVNEKGGIIDDAIVTNMPNYLSIVFNAGRKLVDLANLQSFLDGEFKGKDVKIEHMTDRSLVAFQGPKAATVLQRYLTGNLSNLSFMEQAFMEMPQIGEKIGVMRCGYTGEDGFELSVTNKNVTKLMDVLYKPDNPEGILPAGLGARDSLRLEAGLCLYGHDMNENITPVEANLRWLIGKRRRQEGGFKGYEVIKSQLANFKDLDKRRIGFTFSGGPPARENSVILDTNDKEIGYVTSGTQSPLLKTNIGMGYVNHKEIKEGTNIKVKVRTKVYDAVIAKTPFVPSKYYKK